MIEVRGLERRFGDHQALAGIDFRVAEGSLYGLLGPNGAGKSTTMKILATLLPPSGGSARVAGHDVVREAGKVRQVIGVLFQEPTLDDRLTARENLQIHVMIYGVPRGERKDRIAAGLAGVALVPEADRLVRTFSGGMRRRLEIARALLHRPRVLLLDEPTSGLDPQSRSAMWDQLAALRRSERLTVVVSTHYLEEAERCDRVAIVDHGRLLVEETPAEIRALAEDGPRARSGPVTLEEAFLSLTGRAVRAETASARDVLRRGARAHGLAR